jgi:hypothetical protein
VEWWEGANLLDKHGVSPGSKKHGSGGGTRYQDFREGSPLHKGDEEYEPYHQVAHGTSQNKPNCRLCKWLDGKGRNMVDKAGNPKLKWDKLFANNNNEHYHGCPKIIEISVGQRRTMCYKSSLCMMCLDMELIYKQDQGCLQEVKCEVQVHLQG